MQSVTEVVKGVEKRAPWLVVWEGEATWDRRFTRYVSITICLEELWYDGRVRWVGNEDDRRVELHEQLIA